MANKYVRSTDGLDADDGSTWALAKAKLTSAATAAVAGDTIYISQSHSETTAGAVSIGLNGTVTNPVAVIGASDASEPPTAASVTPSIAITGNNNMTVSGSGRFYGININGGSGANGVILQLNKNALSHAIQVWDTCDIFLNDTSDASEIRLGTATDTGITSDSTFRACRFKLSNLAALFRIYGYLRISGGSFVTGSITPSNGLFVVQNSSRITIEDFDFSNLATSLKLFTAPGSSQSQTTRVQNCKLPAGWSGSLVNVGYTQVAARFEMYNCSAGAENYRLWIEDAPGSIRDETVIVMTGGASDGTTTISNKMVSNTYAKADGQTLIGPDLLTWVDTVGASKTATVEIIHDSATSLNNAEIWLEYDYLGTAGTPLGVIGSTRIATPLTTPADLSASAESWTTTGLTAPNKQKMSFTFTPQIKGWVRARVVMAKASKTVYYNPSLTVA